MHFSTIAAFVAATAVTVNTSPAIRVASLDKRDYQHGQCGVHFTQSQRAYNDDWLDIIIKDNSGQQINTAGDCVGEGPFCSAGLSDATPLSCPSALDNGEVTATQPANSHDVNLSYDGYNFGTGNGCSVGDWDDGTRQSDCGFSC